MKNNKVFSVIGGQALFEVESVAWLYLSCWSDDENNEVNLLTRSSKIRRSLQSSDGHVTLLDRRKRAPAKECSMFTVYTFRIRVQK